MGLEWGEAGPPKRNSNGYPVCQYCEARVNPEQLGAWQEVTGWVQKRRGGGAHSISLQEPTGRVACGSCMALARTGANPEQGAMFP